VEAVLQRLALVIVPPWLLSIVAAAVSPASQWMPALVWAATLAVAAGYLAYLVASPRRSVLLVGPLVVTAVLLCAGSPVGLSVAGYPLVASWLNLVCVVVGTLLTGWRFIPVGALTVAVALIALGVRQASAGTPLAFSDLAAIATFSIGDLFLLGLPVAILRRTAARADAAAARAAAAAEERARVEARQREFRRTSRLLHDTVVNTLGAIARWGRADRATVVRRCRADLDLLRAAQAGPAQDPGGLLDEVRRRAEVLGLHLGVTADPLGPPLADGTAEALVGALAEVLTNVHKHAGVTAATLVWRWDGRSGAVVIADQGRGFAPEPGAGWRGGAAESISARCRDAGIEVRLTSRPGAGTRVALLWDAGGSAGTGGAEAAASSGADPALPHELRALAAETVTAMAVVVAIMGSLATLALPEGLPQLSSLMGVALVAAVGVWAWTVERHRSAGVPGVLYPLLAVIGTWLPGIGESGCARTGIWGWGGNVGLVVAMAAILLDGRRAVVISTVAGVAGGMLATTAQIGPGNPACVQEQLALLGLFSAALLAGVAYRHQLARAWRIWAAEDAALQSDLAEVARVEEAGRTRHELLGQARGVAEPILAGLAEGRLDPEDEQVRRSSALAEATLRALSTLTVIADGQALREATSVLLAAHARGITVHVTVAAAPDGPESRVFEGTAKVGQALAACPDGSTVRVTVLPSGRAIAVLLLAELPSARAAAEGGAAPDPEAGHLASRLSDTGWTTTVVGQQVLAEMELGTP
jgi:signal transduction histidine kinase